MRWRTAALIPLLSLVAGCPGGDMLLVYNATHEPLKVVFGWRRPPKLGGGLADCEMRGHVAVYFGPPDSILFNYRGVLEEKGYTVDSEKCETTWTLQPNTSVAVSYQDTCADMLPPATSRGDAPGKLSRLAVSAPGLSLEVREWAAIALMKRVGHQRCAFSIGDSAR